MKYFVLDIGRYHIYQFILSYFYQWSPPEEQKAVRRAYWQAGHKVAHTTTLKYEL